MKMHLLGNTIIRINKFKPLNKWLICFLSIIVFVTKGNGQSLPGYNTALNIGVASNNSQGRSIARDAQGNLYIIGQFLGTNVDFDPSGATNTLSSAGFSDIFVAKYSSSGAYQWAFNIGGNLADIGYDIVVDPGNNIYITGSFQGSTIDFDPSGSTNTLSSAGNYDIFVAKYNSNGVYQWAFNIGGTGIDNGYSIALDGSNNVILTGSFSGSSIDFDPSGSTNTLSSAGSTDIYVAKYNSSGAYQWAFNIGGSSSEMGNSITSDGNNNIIITGGFIGTSVDFDPSGSTNSISGGGSLNQDLFVAKYNSSGAYQWAFSIVGSALDAGYDIATDKSNNILLTGAFAGTSVDFDPSGSTNALSAIGSQDIFVAKYNSSGTYQWAFNVGGG